jgi:hypothetical protein
LSESPINVFSVPDFHYIHHEFICFDGIDDAILPLADSVALPPRQFLRTPRPWIIFQALDPFNDALAVLFIRDSL